MLKIVKNETEIAFINPTSATRDTANKLSMWLYQISEDEFTKNRPAVRVADDRQQPPPLALDLFYLLTPHTASPENDLLVLGRAMQALYDRAITTLVDDTAHVAEELRITLHRRTLEELTRVWEALREPYRLSVCYEVRLTRLDSTRMATAKPVVEITEGFGHDTELLDVP